MASILSTFRVCYCAKARRDFELTTSDFPCGSRSEVAEFAEAADSLSLTAGDYKYYQEKIHDP